MWSIHRSRKRQAIALLLVLSLLMVLLPGAALAQPGTEGDLQPSPAASSGGKEIPMTPDEPRVGTDQPISAQAQVLEASGDYRIDSLLSGYKWNLTTITYSFYSDAVFGGSYYGSETVSEVSEPVKANVRQIMAWYQSLMNVNFVEVAETPTQIGYIRFMDSSGPGYAYAYYPTNSVLFALAGDVHLNPAYDRLGDTNGFQHPAGKHGFMSLIHEVGHTLGLKHPHEGSPILPAGEDNTATTVMTYDFRANSSGTPMAYDLLALHYLYGARDKWVGNSTYSFGRGADQYTLDASLYLDTPYLTKQTIWDTGGLNILDFSGMAYNSGGYRLDLKGIGWLTANSAYHSGTEVYFDYGTAIAEGVVIRDIINSSSSDTIYANSSANTFMGYGSGSSTGNDVIYDASPADTVDLTGYDPGTVSQTQAGNDLVLGLGANGSITIKDYYLGNQPEIIFSGSPPLISIDDVAIAEGNGGSSNATFTVALSRAGADIITVDFATANGSAQAGSDYTAASGTVTFLAGETEQPISIAISGDRDVEADEGFVVNLSNPVGAEIADGQGSGSILNDDLGLPTDLAASPVSTSRIDLAWTDNASGESGYRVERSPNGSSWSVIATLGANSSSYADSGLAASTTYYYRVQAFSASATSDYSNMASATTDDPQPPSAPSNLAASAVSQSQIDLSWDDNSGDETGFRIERSPDGAGWSLLDTVAANTTAYSDGGLQPGTEYFYRVLAYNAVGDSPYSNTASATTDTPPPLIEQFANGDLFVAGTVSGDYTLSWTKNGVAQSITERESGGKPLSRYSYLEHKWTFAVQPGSLVTFVANAWAPPSNDGDRFVFAYSLDNVNFTDMFTIEALAAGGADQSYLLPASSSGTVYVRVTDTDQGQSHRDLDTVFVDLMVINTEAVPGTPPAAPSGLLAVPLSSSEISLSWADNADDENGFYIERSPDGSSWTQIDTVGADVTVYVDAGLEASTAYSYRVRAFNGSGQSGYSNMASTSTMPPTLMHVDVMAGVGTSGARSRWDAQVTITIRDSSGQPVAGAMVSGDWSGGASGGATCVTGADGACSVSKSNLKSNVASVTFTVTGVTANGYAYDPGANQVTSVAVTPPGG